MRLKMMIVLGLVAVSAGQARAGMKEFFYADGWFAYCRPVMERVALKTEVPSDGEATQSCLGYVMGATDSAFLFLMHKKRACPAERANRQEVLARVLESVEGTAQPERARLPLVSFVNQAVAAQCSTSAIPQ